MTINPLDENDPEYRRQVEERAYHLWQADGEPHGRSQEYWERAQKLVDIENAGMTGQKPNPAGDPDADPDQTEPVENAAIQENLGEFPDRFADQGEKTAAPKAKARKKAAPALKKS